MGRAKDSDARLRATNPKASAWVSASAGTGKTTVLTERVLRLLLEGADPGRILCITYTRAAAAEMAIRINGTLAEWAIIDTAKLEEALTNLTGASIKASQEQRARSLFAHVLDAPGGMQIMTIHAFCQSLLRRFPVEADIAPHFDVLDDNGQQELTKEALKRLYADAAKEPALGAALEIIAGQLDEDALQERAAALIKDRAKLAAIRRRHGGTPSGIRDALCDHFELPHDCTPASVLEEACAEDAFAREDLQRAAEAMALSKAVTDQKSAKQIAAWLAAKDKTARVALFDDYRSVFLTREGTPRARLMTKPFATAEPVLAEAVAREAERIHGLEERRKAARLVENSYALMVVAERLIALYEAEKKAGAALDYVDQIERARILLTTDGRAAWVLYKLDGGIDHVLVDEAQDTAPAQWAVIGALIDEFYAGEGAREIDRTLFVVGDEKQSIYSFQGAEPEALARNRERFDARAAESAKHYETVPLEISYRSTAAVLRTVDAVFAAADARAGLSQGEGVIRHLTSRKGQAGRVELWPVIEPTEIAEAELAQPAERQELGDDPQARLATLIAERITTWLGAATGPGSEAWLDSRARPVRPGDIMVLVRRRTPFVEHLVRALKERRIPVAGVDRMVVSDQLAVRDLIALGEFLLLPEDDLTLACVLKSPLIGLDEETLFHLAHERAKTQRLWRALRARADEPALKAAATFLSRLLARVDQRGPFQLYAELLAAEGGRKRIVARLGPQANDPLDEFLALALNYERDHARSLQGFLHWIKQGGADIKRDLEQGRDEVRVLTVHGAKGLEAPIVLLPDTMQPPPAPTGPFWLHDAAGAPMLLLWPGGKDNEEPVAAAARAVVEAAQEAEYRRLLYVALTRAEDRLYVAGWGTKNKVKKAVWYDYVAAGLRALPEVRSEPLEGVTGERLILDEPQTEPPDRTKEAAKRAAPIAGLPDWLSTPAPIEKASEWIAASQQPGEPPPMRAPLDSSGGSALMRGRLVHRLLEILPEMAPALRPLSIERLLARRAADWPAAERSALKGRLLDLIEGAAFADLFGPDSLAESPLIAAVNGRTISGQVDRLVVKPDQITVVDYKTGRAIPERPEAAPAPYLAQMAAYRAALRLIFPGRPVRCALLFTDGPVLHVLPDALLDPYAP
jgi:ATP-dependent helicase/nuclease subunit A